MSGGLTRRELLKSTAAMGALFGTRAWAAGLPEDKLQRAYRPLILIEVRGGHDGLAAVVPASQPMLKRLRPTLSRSAGDGLQLDAEHWMGKSLGALARTFQAGKLAIVEGVGIPGSARSHFRAADIWYSADPERGLVNGGWIARLGDLAWAERGSDAVVHFGSDPSRAHFSSTRTALVVENPAHFASLGKGPADEPSKSPRRKAKPDPRQEAIDRIRVVAERADRQSLRVRAATAGYRTPVEYPLSRIASNLRDIAALLFLPDDQPAYVLSTAHGGFDTHARQEAGLSRPQVELDQALAALMADLGRSELGQQAVVVVYSEFGRRAAENGSQGTDHGKAGPVFVLGHQVQGGFYGQAPDLENLDEGDVRVTCDFRSIYATLIEGIFQRDSAKVLGGKHAIVPFLA
ncbi:MAG: DUF1501 domain-containing protein [Planctomycetota bacterium]